MIETTAKGMIENIAENVLYEKARLRHSRKPTPAEVAQEARYLERVYMGMDLSGLDPVGAVVRESLFDAGWRRYYYGV